MSRKKRRGFRHNTRYAERCGKQRYSEVFRTVFSSFSFFFLARDASKGIRKRRKERTHRTLAFFSFGLFFLKFTIFFQESKFFENRDIKEVKTLQVPYGGYQQQLFQRTINFVSSATQEDFEDEVFQLVLWRFMSVHSTPTL